MKSDKRENETLQILDQVVKGSQTIRVLAAINVHQTAYLAGVEADVLVLMYYFQLLATWKYSVLVTTLLTTFSTERSGDAQSTPDNLFVSLSYSAFGLHFSGRDMF